MLTPKSGSTSTTHARRAGRSAATARSPRPTPKAVPPFREKRHVGAERRPRSARSRAAPILTRQSVGSARSAAAASLLPPPRPACSGIRFSMRTRTPAGSPRRPAARHSSSAARQTRFVRSTGHAGSSAVESRTARATRERQRVVQRKRLKRRAELVIAVGAHAEHAQRQVDLRERPDTSADSAHGIALLALGQADRFAAVPASVIGSADGGIFTSNAADGSVALSSTCDSARRRSNRRRIDAASAGSSAAARSRSRDTRRATPAVPDRGARRRPAATAPRAIRGGSTASLGPSETMRQSSPI